MAGGSAKFKHNGNITSSSFRTDNSSSLLLVNDNANILKSAMTTQIVGIKEEDDEDGRKNGAWHLSS